MEISHGHLTVRPLSEEDATLLQKWLSDPKVLQYYGGRDAPYDLPMVYERILAKVGNPVWGCLVLWDSLPVGYLQTYRLTAKEISDYGYVQSSIVIYGMDQFLGETTMWTQGIGTTLVSVVSKWLLTQYGADYVVMDPRADNQRAIHVYEKCGFTKVRRLSSWEWHEGRHHDCWLMELPSRSHGGP